MPRKTKAIAKRKPAKVRKGPVKHAYSKAAVRQQAASYVPEAIRTIIAVMRDESLSGHCRTRAAEILWRMGYGQLDVQPGERLPGMAEGETAQGAELSTADKLLVAEAAASEYRKRLKEEERTIDVEAE
jgi:hypothetical protein